ncbi:hypothetical protein GIB67_034752 [Kingdonia uniflora]|uniref:non-specific serine/threonine protein kinase n=1 Tax=Kingdonia uniflora TaxID=39325 RepID=A0A7J7MD31_9MAGN|nr:hypothetical protein GIB67_034752 [Kingdonia uniflora]
MDSGQVETQNGETMISDAQTIMDSQRSSSSSEGRIQESIELIISIAMLLVFSGVGVQVASYYFDGLSKWILYLFAFPVTYAVFITIDTRSDSADSKHVETENGQTETIQVRSPMDSQRVSSSSKGLIDIIMTSVILLVFPVIIAQVISYYYGGLSMVYLYAFGITFGAFYIIGMLLGNDALLYKKCKHQMKVASLVSISCILANYKKYKVASLVLISFILASTLIFYFCDELIKISLFLYTSSIRGIFFILYMFIVFLSKLIALVLYFYVGLSKSFLFPYALAVILSIMCVFLYKKYNNQTKVTRLNGEFQYKDLKKATNNFRDKLGSGMSGLVFKGKLDDGTLVAVKSIEVQQHGKRLFEAEISAIASADHAHLVCLRGYCSPTTKGGTFFIVYDLFPNSSLDNWIFPVKDGQNGGCLTWKQRYRIAIEVAKALGYLHRVCSPRIFHLDIKPENVLLDDDFRAVLSDFGLSKLISKVESKVHTTIRGTPGYMAPEWYSANGISEKCDIFSYGKVLLDIFFGEQFVCLDQNGNDIYRRNSEGGNTPKEQQTFHAFMWEKLTQKELVHLIDKRLVANGEVDENEANCLVFVALCCLEEDPKTRPGDMWLVVNMLERRKLDGIDISKKVLSYKEYDNQTIVARFSREFRYKELEMATKNFLDKLGSCRSGSVFKGTMNNGTSVAVKRVQAAIHGEQEFREEVSKIASLEHAHLVCLRGYCGHVMETGNVSFFVYDFFSNGSLDSWIFPWKGGYSSYWGFRYKVAEDVAKALEYLHGQQILHLCIKPENILLDDNFEAVVSDFGLSELMRKDENRVLTTIKGMAGYMAPERFLGGNRISDKCDVFSYGVLLLDMFFGERNVCLDGSGKRSDKQDDHSQGQRLSFYTYMRDKVLSSEEKILELIDERLEMVNARQVRSLLETALMCLQEDPEERPDMRDVIKMLGTN